VTGATFENNTATAGRGYGGAIFADYYSGRTSLTDCVFTGNQAMTGGAVYDLAAYYANAYDPMTFTVTDCAFEDNEAIGSGSTGYGGAIYTYAYVNATYTTPPPLTITDSTFTENSANIHGGAIYADARRLTISGSDTVFEGNTATQYGGAIVAFKPTSITDALFADNEATAGNGGAIYFSEPGGSASTVKLTVADAAFIGNAAKLDGGAIHSNCVLDFSDSEFSKNTAERYGGAMAFSSLSNLISATITGCRFAENVAVSVGGGIYAAVGGTISPLLTVGNTVFCGNVSMSTAAKAGGAIHTLQLRNLVVNAGVTFTENEAVHIYDGTIAYSDTDSDGQNDQTTYAANVTPGNPTLDAGYLSAYNNADINYASAQELARLKVKKEVSSSDFTSTAQTFSFRYTQVDDATGAPYTGGVARTGTASTAGSITVGAANARTVFLPLVTGLTQGIYYFKVEETGTAPAGWTFATNTPVITVTVAANGSVSYADNSPVFVNSYVAPTGTATLNVNKAVVSADIASTAQTFDFAYVQVDDQTGAAWTGAGAALSGTASTSGSITVGASTPQTVAFASIGGLAAGDYYFKITETVPGAPPTGWTYDANASTGYVVQVHVASDGTVTYPGTYNNTTAVPTFTNRYTEPSQPPGQTYTVTYFPNYPATATPGDGAVPAPETGIPSGGGHTVRWTPLPSAPTQGGGTWTFAGWDENPAASTPTYASGGAAQQIANITSDRLLYAVWTWTPDQGGTPLDPGTQPPDDDEDDDDEDEDEEDDDDTTVPPSPTPTSGGGSSGGGSPATGDGTPLGLHPLLMAAAAIALAALLRRRKPI
jgi:predicted outer membrane repeat protein